VHEDFDGIHLETFVGLSNRHISKTTNFNFSQSSPPSHLALPWCTDQLGHVQYPPNSKLSCTKTFMVLIWDICKPFQPSHLKNHDFHFFTKLPTKPSRYTVVHRQRWPCAKPTELKTFAHQHFHGIHLGTFLGLSNPHISKITNFIFSQNSPPSHLAMPWCTTNLALCKTHLTQNFDAPRISWYSFGKICRPFQPSHLKSHEFQFFTKLPTKPSCYAVVQNPPNSKLWCTKTSMVFIWGHL